MRVGSIVYATDSGLGILAKSFYDAGVINTTVILSHGKHVDNLHWYSGAYVCGNVREVHTYVDWLADLDVLLCFETPFDWALPRVCRKLGVKTVLMPMHECFHESRGMDPENRFDLYLAPSLLEAQQTFNTTPTPVKYLPVPVQVPWRLRKKAEVFVHNAGHGGLLGRNGTKELLQAIPIVQSPVQFILRGQEWWSQNKIPNELDEDHRVSWYTGTLPYDELWKEGDVFVFGEKFNGLSLPLQEARAAGMLVMTTDRFPNNTYLPTEPLIPVKSYKRNQVGPPYRKFDEAIVDPRDIAATIDKWYGADITDYSLGGREWAAQNSWDVLRPEYLRVLKNLCGQSD